jgi:cytochrome c peroxidase
VALSHTLPVDPDALPVLPPAPPLPPVPAGLPALPDDAARARITPEAVALGELLFFDPRLAADGKTSCASCHDPGRGYAGAGRTPTADGKPNLRRAPALVNLAWRRTFGWDGRYPTLVEHLRAHLRGQLGDEPAVAIARLATRPIYRAHLARQPGGAPADDAARALDALAAFTLTRYAGDAPWDRVERRPDAVPAEVRAGYALFLGKAQCSICHVPPLYGDLRYHRLGLIAAHDEGRGRVEPTPSAQGAFATPTLRDAAARVAFFHDGSAPSLDAAIDWHLAGGVGQGADPSIIDLHPIALTGAERAALGAFVRALSAPAATVTRPGLPP